MKNLITCVFVLMVFVVFGQKEKVTEDTKADIFSSRKGSVIEKSWVKVGRLESQSLLSISVPVEILKIKDLAKNDSLFCLSITLPGIGQYDSSTSGYIDAEEIPNIIVFLKTVEEKYLKTVVPTSQMEVTYKCDSGFEIGCLTFKNKWQIFIKPKYYASAIATYEISALPNILSILQRSLTFIKQ